MTSATNVLFGMFPCAANPVDQMGKALLETPVPIANIKVA